MKFLFFLLLFFVSCFKLKQELTIREDLSARINLSYSLDKELFSLLEQIDSPVIKYFLVENIRHMLTHYPTKIHTMNFVKKENVVEIYLDIEILDYSWFTKKDFFLNQKLYERYGRYFYDLSLIKIDAQKYREFWKNTELELIINIPQKIYKTNFQRVDEDTVRLFLNKNNVSKIAEKYFLEFE